MKPLFFIFDIGNVLFDFDFQVLNQRIALDSGLPMERPTKMDLEQCYAVEEGRISDQEFIDYLNSEKGLSWSVDHYTKIWRDLFSINPVGHALFLKAVNRGLHVCTLSNIAEHHMQAIEQIDPHFFAGLSHGFLSYKMGVRKPCPTIYQQVLEKLDADGDQCLFIDDRIENVQAARAGGIQAYRFIPENYALIHDRVRAFLETEG